MTISLLDTFIVNHYWEAIQVINDLEDEVNTMKQNLRCSDHDFDEYITTEKEYLANLEKLDPILEMKKDYVKALGQLVQFKYVTYI